MSDVAPSRRSHVPVGAYWGSNKNLHVVSSRVSLRFAHLNPLKASCAGGAGGGGKEEQEVLVIWQIVGLRVQMVSASPCDRDKSCCRPDFQPAITLSCLSYPEVTHCLITIRRQRARDSVCVCVCDSFSFGCPFFFKQMPSAWFPV